MKRFVLLIVILIFVLDGNAQRTSRGEKALNKGINLSTHEDYRGAITELTKAIELDREIAAFAYNCRGNIKILLEDYRGAISDYTKALDFMPYNRIGNFGYYQLYVSTGKAKINLGSYTEAILDLNTAITKYGRLMINEEPIYYRGMAKFYLNDSRGALSDFDGIIGDKSKGGTFKDWPSDYDYKAYTLRGLTKERLNDKKGALADYNQAIEKRSNYKEALYYRGLLKISMGQKSAGCQDLRKAGDLGHPKAYSAISLYCQ